MTSDGTNSEKLYYIKLVIEPLREVPVDQDTSQPVPFKLVEALPNGLISIYFDNAVSFPEDFKQVIQRNDACMPYCVDEEPRIELKSLAGASSDAGRIGLKDW